MSVRNLVPHNLIPNIAEVTSCLWSVPVEIVEATKGIQKLLSIHVAYLGRIIRDVDGVVRDARVHQAEGSIFTIRE